MNWIPRLSFHIRINNWEVCGYFMTVSPAIDVSTPLTLIVRGKRRDYWFGWARSGIEIVLGRPYRFYFGGSPWRRIRRQNEVGS